MSSNIVSYAEKAFDTFSERPFCSVDSLILSWISYFNLSPIVKGFNDWDKIPLTQLFHAEHFDIMFQDLWDIESSKRLLTALVASPRYRNINVLGYREEFDTIQEKQFAAVSFQLTPDFCYVAFRGTDSTIIGWKEDFNMAYKCPIPSQETAVKYLAEAAEHCTGSILAGGHSKGGNLAVYAAAKCGEKIRNRIERVYSHDGPGFLENVLQSDDFIRIRNKIEKTLPQSSIIGMLLEQQENFQIVKSNRISFLQHDPFSWIVEDNSFCCISSLTQNAKYLNKTLNTWIRQLSEFERERFVDSLYGILSTNDITTFAELTTDWSKNVPAVVHAASQMDADTKKFLLNTLKELALLSVKNFPEMLTRHPKEQ